jgi:hypothetical protein
MILLTGGAVAVAAVAVVCLSKVCMKQSHKLTELSLRKPYWVMEVEKNSPGIKKIVALEARLDAIDGSPVTEPDSLIPQPETPLPSFTDDDAPDPNAVEIPARF